MIINKDVLIVGGGPAGLLLGLLLAKAEIDVMVVEGREDFDREYRGEVLQPRFLQLLAQLNLRSYIESFPHSKIEKGYFYLGCKKLGEFSFTDINKEIPYAMWMSQPILLQALYQKAIDYPNFSMMFNASVKELVRHNNQISGAVVETGSNEKVKVEAKITVGADGRFSVVRRLGNFALEYEHYPGDIIWFTLDRPKNWKGKLQIKFTNKYSYITLPKYPNHLQVGCFLPYGQWREIQKKKIQLYQRDLEEADQLFLEFAKSLSNFKSFVPLQAKTHLVKNWAKDGCILIGDAAHCSSPLGAIGVSLAASTAVVAARVIRAAIHTDDLTKERLNHVQEQRLKEIRDVHQIQERLGKIMFTQSWLIRKIRPYILSILFKTPLITYMQKRFLAMNEKDL